MNPIRLAALLLVAASVPLAAAQQRDVRPVSGFDAVSLSAPVELTLVQGDAEGLVLEGDEADLAGIETLVEDGTLRIRSRERLGASIFRSKVRGTVKARNVRAVSVAGAGDVASTALHGAVLRISVSGSGDVKVDRLDYGELHVSVSGSGDVTVAGKSGKVGASIAGSGNVNAGALQAREVKVSIAGSGDATVAAREDLVVSIMGSGDVRYYGDPALRKSVLGSGSVRRAGPSPS